MKGGRTGEVAAAVAIVVAMLVPLAGAASAAVPPSPPDTSAFCANVPATDPFVDIPAGPHHDNIRCLSYAGITVGTGDAMFNPSGVVTRGQMATFIVRALNEANVLENSDLNHLQNYNDANRYPDVNADDTHVAAINILSNADVVHGYPDGTYRPTLPVTRGQMASVINRAEQFLTGRAYSTNEDYFTDDSTSSHEPDINAIASVGITQGTTDHSTYAPDGPETRAQMATFLVRWLAVEYAAGRIKRLPGST